MSALAQLIAAHTAALALYDATPDEDSDTRSNEVSKPVDATRDAILDHRPDTLDEVRTKAAYMAATRSFSDWDDFDQVKLIHALTPTAPASPPPGADPVLDLVNAMLSGEAALAAYPRGASDEELADRMRKHADPPRDAILDWDGPASTITGAIAALRLARQKHDDYDRDPDMANALLDAVLGYFDQPHETVVDPVIAAIDAHRDACARFEEDFDTKEEHDRFEKDVLIATFEVLCKWEEPAKTRAGAMAILSYISDDYEQVDSSDALPALIDAARAFFDQEDAR